MVNRDAEGLPVLFLSLLTLTRSRIRLQNIDINFVQENANAETTISATESCITAMHAVS